MGSFDRQVARRQAKTEFKKLQKAKQLPKNASFPAYYEFYVAKKALDSRSGVVKSVAEEVSVEDTAILDDVMSSVIDIEEITPAT